MELIVALALMAAIVAWWIARTRAQRKTRLNAAQRAPSDGRSTLPVIRNGVSPERPSPLEDSVTTQPRLIRPYAEMADQNGGVREASAEEVTALFQPIRTRLGSLRKVAANSTRVAQAFGRTGGATPNLDIYRGAHREAAGLAEKTEALLDLILFATDGSSNEYNDLLERLIDVGLELEENLTFVADVEAKVVSGTFIPVEPVKATKARLSTNAPPNNRA